MALTAMQSYVMKQLDKGEEISPELIKLLVDDFSLISSEKKKLYDRYSVKDVPIQHRQMPDGTKVNNKLVNDFAGEIVDTKVGYLLGEAVKCFHLHFINLLSGGHTNGSINRRRKR